jgi:hypothetical protein
LVGFDSLLKYCVLPQHLIWREQERFLKTIMTVLVCALPIAIWKAIAGMYGILARYDASRLRTFADAGFFFTISSILYTAFTSLIPEMVNFKSCMKGLGNGGNCMMQAQALLIPQIIIPILNAFMLMWEILRYCGNIELQPAQKASGKTE